MPVSFHDNEVILQGMSLETLLDEFVMKIDSPKPRIKKYNIKVMPESLLDRYVGGIWTRTGLSYIAKVNKETREWELI